VLLEFRGNHIVKINKIYSFKEGNEKYDLILMEKADLYSLGNFLTDLYENNKLNLIYMSPTNEVVGDNLLRFYTRHIVKGLEQLDRCDFIHFDIKPNNILIFNKMILKLADFGLLRNPKQIKEDEKNILIPGGTPGYMTPEFYENNEKDKHKISKENAKKQDYFALGSTLICVKYGTQMLKPHEYEDDLMTADYLIELIHKAMDYIKSQKLADKDFIDFICNLIQYKPEERYIFEDIYRNKWLNKNVKEIKEIYDINQLDERKLLVELNKSDYLIDTLNDLEKNKKNINNLNYTDKNENHKNDKIKYRKNKFTFKNKKYQL
jgi:serine/threonine protein kinase